jgi:hypothetical protein
LQAGSTHEVQLSVVLALRLVQRQCFEKIGQLHTVAHDTIRPSQMLPNKKTVVGMEKKGYRITRLNASSGEGLHDA